MPKRYKCRSRFLSRSKKKWDNGCYEWANLVYTRATSSFDAKTRLQKRRLVPIGYYCEACDTFMTFKQYDKLDSRVNELEERDRLAREKSEAERYLTSVISNLTQMQKYERRLAAAKQSDDKEEILNAEDFLNLYWRPEKGMYHRFVTPEAKQKALELANKYNLDRRDDPALTSS